MNPPNLHHASLPPLCLAALLVAVLCDGLRAQTVEVPNLFAAGELKVKDIEDRMADVGWSGGWLLVSEVKSDDAAQNTKVSSQIPRAGVKIFEGDKIHLMIPNLGGEGEGVAPVFLYLSLAFLLGTAFFAWRYFAARAEVLQLRKKCSEGDD